VVKFGASVDNEAALAFLKVLQRYQVAAVPFENLNLHYAVHRYIPLMSRNYLQDSRLQIPSEGATVWRIVHFLGPSSGLLDTMSPRSEVE
jgi:hypothetical protein